MKRGNKISWMNLTVLLIISVLYSTATLVFGQPRIEDFSATTGAETYRAVFVKPDSYGDSVMMIGTNKGKALFGRGRVEDSLTKFEFNPFTLSTPSNGLVRSIDYISDIQGYILTSDGIYSSKSKSLVWTQIASINRAEFAKNNDSIAELWGMSFVNKSGKVCVDGVYFKRDSDDIDKELLLCTNNIFEDTPRWDEPSIKRNGQSQQIQLTNIFFDNNQRGWAVGTDGVEGIVWNSTNGGDEWEKQDVPMIKEPLLSVTGAGNKVFVVGYNGTVFSKESAANTITKNRKTQIVGKIDRQIKVGDFVKVEGGILSDYLPDIPGISDISEVIGRVEKVNKDTGMLSIIITKVSPDAFFKLVKEQFKQKDISPSKVSVESKGKSSTKISDDDSKEEEEPENIGSSEWKQIIISTNQTLRNIKFSDDGKIGFIVGNKGTILYTTDGGNRWQPVQTVASLTSKQRGDILKTDFYSIFIDKNYCWIVGSNGAIAKINISLLPINKMVNKGS